ncbi:hypothetical protein [Deinococcus ruber]|uniref:Uncharacterized protein n=1 Tax=Deinococcus ruber TaxID=1848197 RepID=A0A918F8R7_9DEIO|nr:hypothetical protein [Deinococcus ruber]GGR16361.1 hypothetical protein GCM10008957_31260 [Deinococcus ruber]
MSRTQLTTEAAEARIVEYAREQHALYRHVLKEAALLGIDLLDGRLMMIGGRWFLVAHATAVRRFSVLPPQKGSRSRTVTVPTRARLAVNLCEMGYPATQAGRHAHHAWKTGQAKAGATVVIGEVE